MSIFDPYQLYIHPQRKSHKGQVQQKKPYDPTYAITERELQRSLAVVQAYGYTINRPIGGYYFGNFSMLLDEIEETQLSLTMNYIFPRVVYLLQDLQQFITAHPTADQSSVLLGISSLFVLTYEMNNVNIQCINDNDYATISQTVNLSAIGSRASIVLTPASRSQFYISNDTAYNLSSGNAGTYIRDRSAVTDNTGFLNHCTVNNKWGELISSDHLLNDMQIINLSTQGDSYVRAVCLQGIISIVLN